MNKYNIGQKVLVLPDRSSASILLAYRQCTINGSNNPKTYSLVEEKECPPGKTGGVYESELLPCPVPELVRIIYDIPEGK
jgi:hypothetical protein